MKIVVDYDLCEANALCMEAAPEVFRVEEDDSLTVLLESPAEDLRAKVEEAAVMQQEIKAYSARFSAGGVPMLKQALARKLSGYPTHVRLPLTKQG